MVILMQLRNTSRRYGIISISLHWIFAIAVYAMFGLGLWMVTLSYYDGWYHRAPELHKSIGVLLMMGLVIRVIWRHISPRLPRQRPTVNLPVSALLPRILRFMRCSSLF